MPSVSFVCTIYNKEKFLPEVLQSIQDQSGNFDKEFVFIDDGSTDNSLLLLKKLTSNWSNTIIISQKNAGVAAAVNRGISLASMKYIKFVETDDILFEHTTHKLIECCEQLNTFAATGLRGESSLADNIVNPQSKACIVENTLASVVENPRLLLGNTTSLINTSIAKKLGGANPDIISIPDFSLTLDFALNYKIALLDAVVTTELGAASSERLSGNILQEQYDSARVIYQFISYNQKELYGSLDEYYLFRRAIKHLWAVAKRKKIPLPKRLNYQIKFYRSKRTRPFCFKSNQYKKVLLDWLNDYESYFKNNLKITYPSKPILSPNPYSKISSP